MISSHGRFGYTLTIYGPVVGQEDVRMDGILMVLCTCPESAAKQIAETLVKDKLAACVNLSQPIISFYRWEGKLEKERERQLTIKTTKAAYKTLEAKLQDIHPYDVPEILAVETHATSHAYQTWVEENVI